MFNRLLSLFYRPENGWDPIPPEYARKYSLAEENFGTSDLLNTLDHKLGGLAGKRVLDLGGGPGHYSVAMALRGAKVHWHDISATYREIASARAREAGCQVSFSLGYLEDILKLRLPQFDLVFCRICWCYCMDDRGFARIVYRLITPGGAGYIDANNHTFEKPTGLRRLVYWLNNTVKIKIGHPHPPRGRIAQEFSRFPLDYLEADYRQPTNDRVFFVRARRS